MKNLNKIFTSILAAVLFLAIFAPPVSADSQLPLLAFRSMDARTEQEISSIVSWSGPESEIFSAAVSVNGSQIAEPKITRYSNLEEQAIVFLVDTSQAAIDSGLVEEFRTWFLRWQTTRSAAGAQKQSIALYAVGASPVMVLGHTTDQEKQNEAVQRLRGGIGITPQDPTNKTSALWDAAIAASSNFPASSLEKPRTIISVSARGNTSEGGATGALANSEMVSRSVAFYSSVERSAGQQRLDAISETTGGVSLSNTSGTTTEESLDTFTDIIVNKQYVLVVPAELSQQELVEVEISIGENQTVGAVTGGQAVFSTAATRVGIVESSGSGFFSSPIFLILGIIILAVGAVVGAYILANRLFARKSFSDQIENYLRPLDPGGREETEEITEVERNRLVRNVLVQRASETAEKISDSRGWSQKIEGALERADVSLKAGEFIFLYVVIIPVAFLIGLATGKPIFFLGIMFFAILGPAAYLSRKAENRKKKFTEQLPDTLLLMSSSMKAGYSLMQAVEAAAQETPAPMRQELSRVVNEIRLGATVPEAFDRLAVRMNNQDVSWASMGISIQREVGGDLSELLDSIANTMIARNRLKREINTLTAEGRLSAYVLAALPVVVLIAVQILNPSYISLLFVTNIGRLLLFVGFVMMVIGLFWMQKIVRIKV